MNILEIIVLIVLLLYVAIGYHTGFLRVLYSLISWILICVAVTFATPYLTDYLENHTGLQPAIQEKCEVYLKDLAEEKLSQEADQYSQDFAGGMLPGIVLEDIFGAGPSAIGDILSDSGIYEEAAEAITHQVLRGIAFFAILLMAGMLSFWVRRMLDVASHIPAVEGPNKMFGAAAGGLKGLVIVWVAFCVIALCNVGGFAGPMMGYIEESPILSYLYEHNILMQIMIK